MTFHAPCAGVVPVGVATAVSVVSVLLGCSSQEIIGYQQPDNGRTSDENRTPSPSNTDAEAVSDADTGTAATVDTESATTTPPDTGPDRDTTTEAATETEACAYPAMYVEGRYLHDVCGDVFIPIGVNEMVVWSYDRTGASIFPEIKKTGANTARFAWTSGIFEPTSATPSELDRAIGNCIASRMVAMPEIHDINRDITDVPLVVDWWTQPELLEIIQKHERFLLINIANGAGNDDVSEQLFVAIYRDAIERIRDAGVRVPLVIDASGYGKNIDMLQATFESLRQADPLQNLVFSLHLWWVAEDGSTQRIIDELQESADIELPLIVSEFAPMAQGCEQHIDVETILGECHTHGFGFFPWSWGTVENTDCEYLGMTTDGIFGHWRDTPDNGRWGEEVAVTDPNSIQNQSVESRSFQVF
jgi:mannan endo-1,4-beta-mannosidase